MTIQNKDKLRSLLDNWPSGTVATSPWLKEHHISRQLIQRYELSHWIKALGHGAYRRNNDDVKWYGALYSLQKQTGLPVHVGGPTAIALNGASHYLRMNKAKVFLFSQPNTRLPKWFRDNDWGHQLQHIKSSFLPRDTGIKPYEYKGIEIEISTLERAIFECLYLSPQKFDLLECYQILEGLVNLRPNVIQDILINCTSIKVKRLFLYMAEKAQLPLFKHLKLDHLNLGSGDRSIVKNGMYNSKYGISLPPELVNNV